MKRSSASIYMPNEVPHPTTVDVELTGGETFVFGDVRFQALATPGHTPGSVCYLMEHGSLRTLFSGDVITTLKGDPAVSHAGTAATGHLLGLFATPVSWRCEGVPSNAARARAVASSRPCLARPPAR